MQDIPDYTPDLNGNAERNIRTVMNMMRSMLKGAGLPKNLWAEAFTSSSKSAPNLRSGLRIYGCTAFFHVPREKRRALDHRFEECILNGYGSRNIYRLLTKKTRKLIIARDVKFDESLLGFGNFRNMVEPLFMYDDEKKDVQAPIEDVKEPTSEKPAFKIAKEVQPVLRRSLRLKAKEDAKKKDEVKRFQRR